MKSEKAGADPRRFARASLAAFAWAAAIVVGVQAATAEVVQSTQLRKYEKGPLTKADFQAKVPSPRPVYGGVRLNAVISTGLYYKYRYEASLDGELVTLTLSEIEVYGALEPEYGEGFVVFIGTGGSMVEFPDNTRTAICNCYSTEAAAIAAREAK